MSVDPKKMLLDDSISLAVGSRFHSNGKVREFKGNTVLCRIPLESRLSQLLRRYQKCFAESPIGASMAFLPPASFHMTLFQGLNDQARTKDRWSPSIPIDQPIEDVHAHYVQALSSVKLSKHFLMKSIGFIQSRKSGGIGLNLAGSNDEEAAKLIAARSCLAAAMNLKARLKTPYRFHISMAYQIRLMSPGEQAILQSLAKQLSEVAICDLPSLSLSNPEFCTFDNMRRFSPVLELFSPKQFQEEQEHSDNQESGKSE